MRATIYIVLVATCMNIPCLAQTPGSTDGNPYGSPWRFEEHIQRFEASDTERPPPTGAIVCIGSSSIRFWHETIADDLAPLTVIPRGFGGSNMNDALHYADRIVLPYKPRAVVVYEGDNDVAQGVSPTRIAETFGKFVEKVHTQLPECRIYFISIKPSVSRWHLWPGMKEANDLVAARCASDRRLTYVDVASGMLNDEGTPLRSIFMKDNLHMTRDGYIIWRDVLKPVLLKSELKREKRRSNVDEGL